MTSFSKFLSIALASFLFLFLSSYTKTEVKNELNSDGNSLLWKIEGDGIKKASYLFGTMHLIQKEYFYFPASLQKIIKKSDLIFFEVDIKELSNAIKAVDLVTLKEGAFQDYFSEKQMDTVYSWAKKSLYLNKELFDQTFSKYKPFVVVQAAMQMNFMGKTESFEININELALKNKIQSKGLEKLEDQMAIFDALSKVEQAQMVMEGIRNQEEDLAELNNMQRLYKEQKVDSLYSLLDQEGGIFKDKEDQFLVKRNQNWIPQIENELKNGQVFIAVGAAHLGGKNGVIALLRSKGYKLTPVKY